MKHTLREILAHFATGAQHTHEAAAQATYDLGHERGREDAKAEFAAGLGDSAPAASTGATSDDTQKDAPAGQPSEEGEGAETTQKDPAAA